VEWICSFLTIVIPLYEISSTYRAEFAVALPVKRTG